MKGISRLNFFSLRTFRITRLDVASQYRHKNVINQLFLPVKRSHLRFAVEEKRNTIYLPFTNKKLLNCVSIERRMYRNEDKINVWRNFGCSNRSLIAFNALGLQFTNRFSFNEQELTNT